MPNFNQPERLPNEASEDMAIRLAKDLELTPLEGETSAAPEAGTESNPLPDPAIEAARAEQTRQDEAARTAELARADALAAQIKGGEVSRAENTEGGVGLSPEEREKEADLVTSIQAEIASLEELASSSALSGKSGDSVRLRTEYQSHVLRSLLSTGVANWQGLSTDMFYSKNKIGERFDPGIFQKAFRQVGDFIKKSNSGGITSVLDDASGAGVLIKFEGRPGSLFELHKNIRDAKGFDELMAAIEKNNGIQGSQRFYPPDQIKIYIDLAREAEKAGAVFELSRLTNNAGFRDKFAELLAQEQEK